MSSSLRLRRWSTVTEKAFATARMVLSDSHHLAPSLETLAGMLFSTKLITATALEKPRTPAVERLKLPPEFFDLGRARFPRYCICVAMGLVDSV